MTTVNGILGGVTPLVRSKMQRDGVYDEFIQTAQKEFEMVFGKGPLGGSQAAYCLPSASVPDKGLADFTACSAQD